jgi:hypothetical protein
MMSIFDNVTTLDQLLEIFPKMSLITQGLLGKPTAPMLIMSGVLDTHEGHAAVTLERRTNTPPHRSHICIELAYN